MDKITVAILTISDRCWRKESTDNSGENLVKMIEQGVVNGAELVMTALVPDSKPDIEAVLIDWCNKGINLVLTTGGTGISERDVTPEATGAVLEKTVSGISMLMFSRIVNVTPLASLSRAVAGVRGKSLIINLPGSEKGSRECLEAVAAVIPHAVSLITGSKKEVEQVHSAMNVRKTSLVVENVAQRTRTSPYPCISVDEAKKLIYERIFLLTKDKIVTYKEAKNYVLAQDLVAQDFLPPFDVSLKDGYAVLSNNTSYKKEVIGVSRMGNLSEIIVSENCCVRVSTGGMIPPGADAVVKVEDTKLILVSKDEEELQISIASIPCKGQNIRQKGSDFKAGELLFGIGTYVDSSCVGLLAAAGIFSVRVYDKPRVGVISTGDELAEPEETLKPGKVRDSNLITLIKLLEEENFQVEDFGIASDRPDALRDSLEKAARKSDVIVTTGSLSMGESDYLKRVLVADFDSEIVFGRVLMKPGKPTSFGVFTFEGKAKLWFGLPGNPASAFVGAHMFLLPALRKISGRRDGSPMVVEATLKNDIKLDNNRPQYVRGVLTSNEKGFYASVTENQRSSRIRSCVGANCLLMLPQIYYDQKLKMRDSLSSGEKVKAFIISKLMT